MGYLSNFNEAKESKYLKSLRENTCRTANWQKSHYRIPQWLANANARERPCESLFTQYNPDGRDNPYRKVEAFLYRRIVDDEWKVEDAYSVLHRILEDLRPLV